MMKNHIAMLSVILFAVTVEVQADSPRKPTTPVRVVSSDTVLTDADDTILVADVPSGAARITLPSAAGRIGKTFTILSSNSEYGVCCSGSGAEVFAQDGESVEGAPGAWGPSYNIGRGARIIRAVTDKQWRVVGGW